MKRTLSPATLLRFCGRGASAGRTGTTLTSCPTGFTANPPVTPSTWYPIWIFRIFAISAGVAVRIDVALTGGEASQRTFRSGVFDPARLHRVGH